MKTRIRTGSQACRPSFDSLESHVLTSGFVPVLQAAWRPVPIVHHPRHPIVVHAPGTQVAVGRGFVHVSAGWGRLNLNINY